jgi:lipopolysaccharide export system permease protein
MRDGQIQRQIEDGTVDVLDFDRYVLQLDGEVDESGYFYLKQSDRTLHQLLMPDWTAHYDIQNAQDFQAEATSRIASPLLSIALAMIALVGVLGGEFSRRGYGRRIMIAGGIALLVRVVPIALQSAAQDEPSLNPVQIALPLVVILVCSVMLAGKRPRRRRVAMGPSVLAEA